MERFEIELKKLFDFYNHKKNFIQRFFEVLKNISAIRTLSVEEKNFSFTQEVIGVISAQKLKGEDVSSLDFRGVCDYLDGFLETKLEEEVEGCAELFNGLTLEETTEFSEFAEAARRLLEENEERRNDIIRGANVLEDIVYPLTKKYFLFRYLAEAITREGDMSDEECASSPKSYENEKKLCLDFSSIISALEEFPEIIQDASERFDSERKCVALSLKISNAVNDHSGKIAVLYAVYIAIITAARYNISEDSEWYEELAWPSTVLAMVQILMSFPQIIFSSVKTEETNNHIFGSFGDVGKISEIQFLDRNIPSFSNNKVSKITAGFRWFGNLVLQPIDLFQNDTKDQILRWGPMRFFTPTGVIEEQGKVAYFVSCELRNFLYDNVVPALVNNKRIVDDEYIRRLFYLLYKQIGRDEKEELKLKEIYITLTGEENVDFENIVSDKEKKQILRYQKWFFRATYIAGILTLAAEYVCFALRNQDVGWYKDPVFYSATAVKFMRLGSLIASRWYADKITEYFTGNKLVNNIYFQDFFDNDAARMVMAVVPLVMFESTNDIKILSIATAVDVLTTVRSDMNSGKAVSMVGKLSTEKLTTKLQCAQEIDNQEASTSQQQLYAQGANNQTNQQKESDTQASDAQSSQQQQPNAQATSTQQQELSIQWFKNKSALDLRWNKKGVTTPYEGTLKGKFSSEPEVSTASSTKSLIQCSKKFKSDEANNQASQQQGAQTQFDQPGPSSKLDEVPLISRSQSLSSLHSNGSDIGVN